MDVAVFHTLKASWRQKVAEWRMDNNGKQVTKHDFLLVLRKLLDTLKQDTIRHGFKACGLVPWNPTEVKVTGTQTTVFEIATKSKSAVENFLRMLAERIGVDKLALFKATKVHWEGPTEDVSLFSIGASAKYELNTEQPSTPVSIIILISKLKSFNESFLTVTPTANDGSEFTTTDPNSRGETRTECKNRKRDYSKENC